MSVTRTASSARFESLYAAHRQAVLAYCLRRLGSDEAPDAASDTFAVAWRRIDDVPDGDGALPWLYGVARRVVANRRRGASRYWRMRDRLLSLRPETVPDPAAQVVKRQELRELEEAVGRLRPIDREILLLHTWEELSHAEIGVALGISVAAVDKRVSRALTRLAREVERVHRPVGFFTGGQDAPNRGLTHEEP